MVIVPENLVLQQNPNFSIMLNKISFISATLIYIFLFALLDSVNPFGGFYDLPEIKVEKWIANSEWDIEEHFEDWNTDFTDIPEDSVKVLDRGSTIIVSQHISGLGIVCNASYPVEWIFDQAEVFM